MKQSHTRSIIAIASVGLILAFGSVIAFTRCSRLTSTSAHHKLPTPAHIPSDKDVIFQLKSSGGLTGSGFGDITVTYGGTWTKMYPTNPNGNGSNVVDTGTLPKSDVHRLYKLISSDAKKLLDDQSLVALCKPIDPDAMYFDYYYSRGYQTMHFDSCWIGANNDQPLIEETKHVLTEISKSIH